MKKGVIRYAGSTDEVINAFKKEVLENKNYNVGGVRFGTREIEIQNVTFLDHANTAKTTFKRGEQLRVCIEFEAKKHFTRPEFAIGFSTDMGVEVSVATTRDHGILIDEVSGNGKIYYSIESVPLNMGRYSVSIGCYDSTGHVAFDDHKNMYEILIEDGTIGGRIHERFGLVHIPARWDISDVN